MKLQVGYEIFLEIFALKLFVLACIIPNNLYMADIRENCASDPIH